MVRYRSDPTGHEVELVTYKVEDLLLLPVSIYAGAKPGGMWLSPTSHLSTGGLLYPCVWPSVSTPLLLQRAPWVQWTDRKTVL